MGFAAIVPYNDAEYKQGQEDYTNSVQPDMAWHQSRAQGYVDRLLEDGQEVARLEMGWELCTVCGKTIDPDSDYDTPHEPDCPNALDQEPDADLTWAFADCDCSLSVHAECYDAYLADCKGDHADCWGMLWRCTGCKRDFCYAEGSAENSLCNECEEQ